MGRRERLEGHRKIVFESVCVEYASSEKGLRERERNRWYGARGKKGSGGRGIKGRVYERRGQSNSEMNKSRKSGCGCCTHGQEKRRGGRMEGAEDVDAEKEDEVGADRGDLNAWNEKHKGEV